MKMNQQDQNHKNQVAITEILLKAIRSEHKWTRCEAAVALAEAATASPEAARVAIEILKEALEDKDEFVRQASIKAIAEILKSTFTTQTNINKSNNIYERDQDGNVIAITEVIKSRHTI